MANFTHENGTADHALFENIRIYARAGWGVVDEPDVTPGPGSHEVTVAEFDAFVDGDLVSNAGGTVDLAGHVEEDPRWVALYVDGNGDVQTEPGTPTSPEPVDDDKRLENAFPAPPDLSGDAQTVVAIVYLPADAGTVNSEDIVEIYMSAHRTLKSVTASQLVNGRTGGALIDEGSIWAQESYVPTEGIDSVSSDTYVNIADLSGGLDTTRIPAGATLYGKFIVNPDTIPDGETATFRPQLRRLVEGGGFASVNMSELELELTDDSEVQSTGYVEITTTVSESLFGGFLQGKVTGGTAEIRSRRGVGVHLEGRVD